MKKVGMQTNFATRDVQWGDETLPMEVDLPDPPWTINLFDNVRIPARSEMILDAQVYGSDTDDVDILIDPHPCLQEKHRVNMANALVRLEREKVPVRLINTSTKPI